MISLLDSLNDTVSSPKLTHTGVEKYGITRDILGEVIIEVEHRLQQINDTYSLTYKNQTLPSLKTATASRIFSELMEMLLAYTLSNEMQITVLPPKCDAHPDIRYYANIPSNAVVPASEDPSYVFEVKVAAGEKDGSTLTFTGGKLGYRMNVPHLFIGRIPNERRYFAALVNSHESLWEQTGKYYGARISSTSFAKGTPNLMAVYLGDINSSGQIVMESI